MATNRFRILKSRYLQIIFGNSLVVTFVLILLTINGVLELAELDSFDHFMRKRPERQLDPNIVLVGITESDIKYFQGWPISDYKLTQILTAIKNQKPRIIGLDLVRDYPVMDGYDELVNFFETTPNIIGIEGLDGINASPILEKNEQVGIADLIQDKDSIIRRAYLTVNITGENKNKMSLAATLALHFLAQENIEVQSIPNEKYSYQLGKSIFHLFKSNDGAYANANILGNQILINYRGRSCTTSNVCKFSLVSLEDILENRIPANLFRDKIVIFGAISPSLNDFHNNPYSDNDKSFISGMEIHAHITSQLIEAAFDENVLFKTWHEIGEQTWLFSWSVVGSFFGVCAVRKKVIALAFIPISFSLYGITYWLFLGNVWIPFITPALGLMSAAVTTTIYILWQDLQEYTKTLESKVKERTFALEEKTVALESLNKELVIEKDKSERLLLNVLPKTIAQRLKQQQHFLSFDHHNSIIEENEIIADFFPSVTVMFADIVGFTQLSAQIPPRQMVKLLNDIFSAFDRVCEDQNLEKIRTIGDNYMVAGGVPIERVDHAQAIADMAIEIQKELELFNLKNQINLNFRIGINSGPAVAGVIGTKKFVYDLWGDPVNIASRMESHGIPGKIQVSSSTYELLKEQYYFEERGTIQVKGKGTMRTYFLLGKNESS
jgi:CHASE2 domain-containing sensor protein/class 3 adenylate cyclase